MTCLLSLNKRVTRLLKQGILLLLLIIQVKTMAQSPIIQGEYYFRRQEMVAGFRFTAEGKFDFFYSYGAVDRNATGSFTVEGDTIKLKSDKEAGKDFTVTEETTEGTGYTLTCQHPNTYLLDYIQCFVSVDGKMQEVQGDRNGVIHIDLPHCDKIYIKSLLYPDIPTLVKDENNTHNRFTLTLNPSLEQVSFKGIDFMIVDDKTISCFQNYFMPLADIQFIKH